MESEGEKYCEFLHNIASKSRLRILYLLNRSGKQLWLQLWKSLQIKDSTISYHLKLLRKSGLIEKVNIDYIDQWQITPKGSKILSIIEDLKDVVKPEFHEVKKVQP